VKLIKLDLLKISYNFKFNLKWGANSRPNFKRKMCVYFLVAGYPAGRNFHLEVSRGSTKTNRTCLGASNAADSPISPNQNWEEMPNDDVFHPGKVGDLR
jgi:hypothetical protein